MMGKDKGHGGSTEGGHCQNKENKQANKKQFFEQVVG